MTIGDEKEEGRDHETHPTPHFTSKEVGGSQHIQVATAKLPPGHGLPPFWRGGYAVTLEDIPHRLVTDGIAQVGQSTHNAIIAPGAIRARHPHHEVFDLFVNARTADRLMNLGTITLLVRERAVPGEDSIGLGNRRDLLECFPTQLLTKLIQGATVAITQRHATRDLLAEDAVLCGKVGITEPEFFVNRFAKRS
jgi:hypothetical protein